MTARLSFIVAIIMGLLLASCQTAPKSESDRLALQKQADETIREFKNSDSTMEKFFKNAVGYAVFPSVGKGAVGVGGAYGRGILYEGGRMVGYCDLSQGTVGLQLGGQAYREIIFFETRDALLRFKSGNFAFAAQASAVAAKHGASADADYEDGVVVFTMARGGLMYEASIGGQKFTFEPM
ncbi:MAG TPA: YSC84-related protein [Phycisphaerales bacterium]|nr:YSC84-related protein [Phycisphaerales bacterium]HRQ74308.1 YSC84-related protein [Phycisphaerales bacterium]